MRHVFRAVTGDTVPGERGIDRAEAMAESNRNLSSVARNLPGTVGLAVQCFLS